jgi:hypothetical protein
MASVSAGRYFRWPLFPLAAILPQPDELAAIATKKI